MLFRNEKGQRVGELKDGVYRKIVSGSKHLQKNMDAWAIDSKIVDTLIKEDAQEIRIKDSETDNVYMIPVSEFISHSVERNFGFGKQMFVSRKFFTIKQ